MSENSKRESVKTHAEQCERILDDENDSRYAFAANAVYNPRLINVPSGEEGQAYFKELEKDRPPEAVGQAATTLISLNEPRKAIKSLIFNLDVLLSATSAGANALAHAQGAAKRGIVISKSNLKLRKGTPKAKLDDVLKCQAKSMKQLVTLIRKRAVDCALSILESNSKYWESLNIQSASLQDAVSTLRQCPKNKRARRHISSQLYLLHKRARIRNWETSSKTHDDDWVRDCAGKGLHHYTAQNIWKCCLRLQQFTEKTLIAEYKVNSGGTYEGDNAGRTPVRLLLTAALNAGRLSKDKQLSPEKAFTYKVVPPSGDSK